jgi:DNA-binding SARP family transcriptional activator
VPSIPQLRVLGSTAVIGSDGLPLPLAAKAVALLAYLRLATHKRAHRAFLADLLWSEVDEERGRASLRQAVLSIRQQLGDGFLVSRGQELQLEGELACDADLFLAAAARGDDLDAVDLYGGPFYSDFALPGARGFEMWAAIEQERFRGVFMRVCDEAAQQLLDRAQPRDAVAVAQRLVAADTSRERSWRLLLQCRVSVGDLTGAGVDAAAMRAALDAEGIALEPATVALLARIERGGARQAAPLPLASTIRGELVGRRSAFSALLTAWRRAASGQPSVIMVTGSAGIGKTRLLEDCSTRLRSLGARVVSVTARYGDREIPYALLQQVTETLAALPGSAGVAPESARTLLAMDPRLNSVFQSATPETVTSVDIPLRRTAAIADLIGAVTDERAVAMLVDDFHWADTASQSALLAAADRITGSRSLLVIAQRGISVSGHALQSIPLDALTQSEIRELLESIARVAPALRVDDISGALLRSTRGNPLLVLEALQLLGQESLLSRTEDEWYSPDGARLMDRLATLDVLSERLARLDPDMRRMLIGLAVAEAPLSEELVAAIGAADTSSTLDRLAIDGWISRATGTISIRHDVLGRGILESATGGEIAEGQRVVVEALNHASERSDVEWRLHARLLLELSDMRGVSKVIDGWLAVSRTRQRPRDWQGAADDLLGDLLTPAVLRRIAAERSWVDRFGRRTRNIATTTALFAVLVTLTVFLYRRSVTPVALRFVTPPLAAGLMGITPEVAVEIVNVYGERLEHRRDTVELRVQSKTLTLEGSTRVVADSGYAVFSSVRARGEQESAIVLEAFAGALRTEPARLLTYEDVNLRIRRMQTAPGSSVRVTGDTVTSPPGSKVSLQIELAYTAPWMAAAVMLAGVPTWGDRTTNSLELGPFPTPIRNGTRFSPVDFIAPTKPGRYFLFLVIAAESDASHIASGTSWTAGAPQWFDGNDLADWGDAEAARIRGSGTMILPSTAYQYKNRRGSSALGVAVVEVVVSSAIPSVPGTGSATR